MRFTKLRLVGFKSFVEPAEFLIQNGLTGVVGPNGCGKSNLVEALRWVMGENSYKNMRASGMDDVIFSGSGHRPGRNAAEVTLFLDNGQRLAPAAFNGSDAIEVTRRIVREAGSVYRINGKEVRARDVQMLFADASTGARSPALVRQGQIGELIAAKPIQRRAILEEASGISGLHGRRNEAEMRLRAAEQNLERLEDVLTQIESQLETLKRQARQAARYRLLSAEIRAGEAAAQYLRWVDARGVLADAEAQLVEADRIMTDRAEAQAAAARDQAVAASVLPSLRDRQAAAGAALQRLRIAASELEAEDRRVRERLVEIDRRLVQIAEDRAREGRIAAETAEATAALDEEGAALAAEAEAAAETAADLADRLAAAEAALADSEGRLMDRQDEAARVAARRAALERSLADLVGRVRRLTAECDAVTAEREALADRLQEADLVGEARAVLGETIEQAEAAEAEAAETEEAIAEARERWEASRAALAEAERDAGRIETEAKTLARMLDRGGAAGRFPPVVDRIGVAPGYEAALAAALGDDLDASTDAAAPVHWGAPGDASADPSLPEGVERLLAHVEVPEVLARGLAQVGLVARSDGARLQPSLRSGQRLVSREGDLWRWDGFIAAAEAPTAAAQRLAARNRLAELESLGEQARALVAERRSAADRSQQAVATVEARVAAAREAVRAARRRVEAARDALLGTEREQGQLASRLSALAEAQSRLEAEIREAEATARADQDALASLPARSGMEDELARLRLAVAADRAAVAEARAATQGFSREADMRRRRLEAIARERASWLARAANAEAQIAVLDRRRDEAATEKDDLSERPADIAHRRALLITEIARAENERASADDAVAAAERVVAEADRFARAALDTLSAAREAKARAEERTAAARARVREIETQIWEAFDARPPALLDLAGLKPEAVLPDLEAVERKLERVRQEREKLGAVNLRAEDEAREVEERRDTMVSERDDLIEAIRRLRLGIQNLNREARERLMSAFDTVNGHFQSLFTQLFGGGTAELQLVESEDPLEAGLEIMARPPGKKPSTMTLLSGGEQALTAMALIFAVFLTNPAPICVLDEVDAPLDDANVERYCDLLADMAARTETRFLVITHNPITMARMDRLYGVTMAERGVSQLVSVDLQFAERLLEAS